MSKFGKLGAKVRRFVQARDWEQFHSPKNLSMAMAIECAGSEPYLMSFAPFGRDARLLTSVDASTPDLVVKPAAAASADRISTLTRREMELLRTVADGASTREIAESHFISQSTVKNHLTSINRKLGVSSRREAIEMVFPLVRSTRD